MEDKRGISPVITTILLIALAVVVVGIVWVAVNALIKGSMDEAESCFGIVGKVNLNPEYTCFETVADEVQFSISRLNINLDEIIVTISGQGGTIKSFILNSTTQIFPALVNYADRTQGTPFPGENEGKTYVHNDTTFTSAPDRVELAITVGGNSCGVVDTLEGPGNC